jgi:hypothetical protein
MINSAGSPFSLSNWAVSWADLNRLAAFLSFVMSVVVVLFWIRPLSKDLLSPPYV